MLGLLGPGFLRRLLGSSLQATGSDSFKLAMAFWQDPGLAAQASLQAVIDHEIIKFSRFERSLEIDKDRKDQNM